MLLPYKWIGKSTAYSAKVVCFTISGLVLFAGFLMQDVSPAWGVGEIHTHIKHK